MGTILLCRLRADPSQWNSTNRPNTPIHHNHGNCWTNDAILMSFKIFNDKAMGGKGRLTDWLNYLSWTLRSWVHEIVSKYRTVSPWLGDISVSKSSSDSFPHTKYMSCMENSQNNTLMFCCSPILGRRFEKQRKLWDRFVTQFFSISWPSPRDWRPPLLCNLVLTVFHTWWCIFCVWKVVRTTAVSQLRGDCSIMWENFMGSGSQSATL